MHSICRTQLKRNILLIAAAAMFLLAVICTAIWLLTRPVEVVDSNALPGEPAALADELAYSEVAPVGLDGVRLCANPVVDGKDIYFYLTNPASNAYMLRAEVYSAKRTTDGSTVPDKLLGTSGFLEPGTYVEKITLDKALKSGANQILLKIALRNGKTGQSEGFFYLNMALSK